MRRSAFAVLVLLFVAKAFASSEIDKVRRKAGKREGGYYIVRLKDDVPGPVQETAERMARVHGASLGHIYSAGVKGFAFRGSDAAARALSNHPHVLYVEEEGTFQLAGVQTPTPSSGLDRVDQRQLPLGNSYTYDATGNGVLIYIMDSGVNPVSDLAGRIVDNQNFVISDPGQSDGLC